MASVDFDVSDYLDELSEKELKQELDKRKRRRRELIDDSAFIKLPDAKIAITEAADFCRTQGRIDLGFKLDEIKNDWLQYDWQ